jgi:hypothetical protein
VAGKDIVEIFVSKIISGPVLTIQSGPVLIKSGPVLTKSGPVLFISGPVLKKNYKLTTKKCTQKKKIYKLTNKKILQTKNVVGA